MVRVQDAAGGGGVRIEVEVFPAQTEEFAFAESGAQGQFVWRVQSVALTSEQLPGLGGRVGLDVSWSGRGGVTFCATLRGRSFSRTACSSADLRTEWMWVSGSGFWAVRGRVSV